VKEEPGQWNMWQVKEEVKVEEEETRPYWKENKEEENKLYDVIPRVSPS
jgi:hypothetical protein